MTVHDDARRAAEAVYDAALAERDALIAVRDARIVELERLLSTPEPEPEPEPVPPPSTARFGTHYPPKTPSIGPGVEVDCTWAAIGAALRNAKPGDNILVRPGTLAGTGAGSTVAGVLSGIDKGRGQRVLIRPRDGYGTVTITSGTAFVNLTGVTFLGFKATGQAILFRNSSNWAWAWSELDFMRVTANGGGTVEDGQWVETVSRGTLVKSDDRHRFVTANDPNSTIKDVSIIGGYGAIIYRPAGSSAHCDYLQVERQTGGGTIEGIHLSEHVAYGAQSQTLMFAGIPGVTLDRVVLLSAKHGQHRYPAPATASALADPRVLNGTADATLTGENIIAGTTATTWTLTGGTRREFDTPDALYTWLDQTHPEPTDTELVTAWKF